MEREGVLGFVEVLRKEGDRRTPGRPVGRYGLTQGLQSSHMGGPGHRGAEAHKLGDGGEDREDSVHGAARGP